MKKFLIILLVLIMALSLIAVAACDEPCTQHVDANGDGKCDNCGQAVTPAPGPGGGGGDDYNLDMDIPENPGTVEDYTLARGENERQVVIYWREKGHDYADNDVWAWYGTAPGQLYEFHPCKYGAKVIINVPADVTEVGFIVRKDATVHTGTTWTAASKVYDKDRFAVLTGDVTEIYLTGANAFQFASTDGGKTLTMNKEIAKMSISGLKQISYKIVPAVKFDSLADISVKDDKGAVVEIDSLSVLGKESAEGVITLKNSLDLSKNYTVTIKNYGEKIALPMEVFDSAEFIENYVYDGNDLGAIVDGDNTTFKLWAPTASNVMLNIFGSGNDSDALVTHQMVRGDKGVWTFTSNICHGTYYTYSVTTAAGTQEAVDPYAKSVGVNGMRGMVVDFDERAVTPDGFDQVDYLDTIDTYTDAIIWEIHVRDFSNQIESSQYKGKYLAFTETGLTNSSGLPVGVDYVKQLGATHLHLLPVYDYKTVDETKLDEAQFNWGYDPVNYNAPEGSYSTNPYDGNVRVLEFRQMVQSLHQQGLGVIMDVVYNHTADANSNLNKVVPNYYYRYNADGTISGGSGCGNDTASERAMYSKYMVDSVVHWLTTYKLDGFRFDLMGLHDINTMQAIEKAVHAINPKAVIYGEAWSMGTAAAEGTVLATQPNIKNITATQGSAGGIAVFNDAIRDGLRGNVFENTEAGYLADPTVDRPGIIFGIQGGEKTTGSVSWTVQNNAVINYISAHDNHTLWDRLANTAPTESVQSRLAMNRIGAAIVLMSKGTPFMQAGEEILRTKPADEDKLADGIYSGNSYNSSDACNNIKWNDVTPTSDAYAMLQYYQGLIALRKASPIITATSGVTVTCTAADDRSIVAVFDGGNLGKMVMVINPTKTAISYTLPTGNWSLKVDGTRAGTTELASATGTVSVAAQSVYVYFSK